MKTKKNISTSLLISSFLLFGIVASKTEASCECTNGPFSGGSACTGGYCDGCHCVYGGTLINGVCGSSNGQSFSSAPTSNLCSAGTVSAVTGSGPWSWTCSGANGGTSANCSAMKNDNGGGTAVCGNNKLESGEECDFNSAFGPYPNQCPNNGPCNQSTCKCTTSPTPTPPSTPAPTPPNINQAYTSVYTFPQEHAYYDGDLIKKVNYTGFHDQYDFDNPINRCNKPTLDNCEFRAEYSLYNKIVNFPEQFRVFIPPGSSSIDVTIYLTGQTSRYVAVARLGQSPTGTYSQSYFRNLSTDEFAKIPFNGTRVANIKDNDYVVTNSAGILSIIGGTIGSESVGQWVYVNIFPLSGSSLNLAVNGTVSTTPFMEWFHTATWDANGDPAGVLTPTPTGPDCAANTCVGNSCYVDDTQKWVHGTKTQDCATGSAKATPTSIKPATIDGEPKEGEISYLTWSSSNASKLEIACTGPTNIP
ncbi:MAG: hypothetical protein WC848_03075, partial [Parcubacteria group bacterium]